MAKHTIILSLGTCKRCSELVEA